MPNLVFVIGRRVRAFAVVASTINSTCLDHGGMMLW